LRASFEPHARVLFSGLLELKNFKSHVKSPIESLATDLNASSLIRQAEAAARLKNALAGWPALRGVTFHIGPVHVETLKIYVSTPAALTRIRQSVPSLVQHLQSLGYGISDILLKVQTSPLPSLTQKSHQKRAFFSENAKKAWLALENKIVDPHIKAATEKLYAHHQMKKNPSDK
jgi:hypothetical protein